MAHRQPEVLKFMAGRIRLGRRIRRRQPGIDCKVACGRITAPASRLQLTTRMVRHRAGQFVRRTWMT